MTEENSNLEVPKPQSEAVTLEQLQQVLGGFKDEISKMVTGMGVKMKKSITEEQQNQVNQLIEQGLSKALSPGQLLDAQSDTNKTEPLSQPLDGQAKQEPADAFSQLQELLATRDREYEQRLQAQQSDMDKRIQAMQKAVEEERLNTAKVQAQSSLLDPIRDRLHNPNSFWRDLEASGIFYDPERNTYGMSGKDEFDNPTFTPLESNLDGLLKSEQYAYHLKPRPGSGLGSQPNGSVPQQQSSNTSYSANSSVDSSTRFNNLKTSANPIAEIANQLAQTAKDKNG